MLVSVSASSGDILQNVYDFDTDASVYKYVSPTVVLKNTQYIPPDLVSLEKIQWVEVRNNEGKLRSEAASALADVAQAFYKTFGKSLVVVSSYRGYEYQKKLVDGYISTMGTGRAYALSAIP